MRKTLIEKFGWQIYLCLSAIFILGCGLHGWLALSSIPPTQGPQSSARSSEAQHTQKITSPSARSRLALDQSVYSLFGVKAVEVADTIDLGSIPTTDRSIRLIGVFVKVQAEESSAIVSIDKDQGPVLLNEGDYIDDSTRLHKVYPDAVVLFSDGELESLYFSLSE
ncbi:MAG: type II secretion system protein N [Halioglobus sp.]